MASARSTQVHATLSKEPGFRTLGIVKQFEHETPCLRVDSVDVHGLAGRHSAKQASDATRVLQGGRIVEVNGVRDSDGMLAACKSSQHLELRIERTRWH